MLFKRKIWKLQRPLASNEEFPTVMAYTEGKANMAIIPMPEEMIDELFGDEPKIYARAKVKNGVLNVREIVEEQDW